jgi:hypothetical protein
MYRETLVFRTPSWLSRRFRMSAEAEFRWQRDFRRPVRLLFLFGIVLIVFALVPDPLARPFVLGAGIATCLGCLLIRLLVADGGRG